MKRLILLYCLLASAGWAGESRIYAQRVSPSGALIGGLVAVGADAAGAQSKPRVAFYDNTFLVVWHEWNGTDLDVKAARIAMDGTVTDPTPLAIATGARTQALPDVAADSDGFLTVWHGFAGAEPFPRVYARRVDPDGALHEPISFGLAANGGYGGAPRIAWNGAAGKHLVVFQSFASTGSLAPCICTATLTTAPVATVANQFVYPGNNGPTYYAPAAMPGGGWSVVQNGHAPGHYFGRVNGGEVAVGYTADGAFDPTGFMGYGSSVNNSAAHKENFLDYQTWGGGFWPMGGAAATDASYVIAVWTRYHQGGVTGHQLHDGDLYAARVESWDPVEPVGGTAVSTAPGASERWPSLAGNGAGSLLVAYDKDTAGATEIMGRVLTVDGGGIASGEEVQIRSASAGKRRSQPAVAYGDDSAGTQEYLVVWTEGWWGVL